MTELVPAHTKKRLRSSLQLLETVAILTQISKKTQYRCCNDCDLGKGEHQFVLPTNRIYIVTVFGVTTLFPRR